MLRYADGDLAAFEVLYRRHNDALYRYLLRLAQHPEVAEDVFQDAWGKIINARQRYRPTAKFSTYLYRVAHNCFVDYLRKNKRHAVNAGIDPDQSPDPGDSPELATDKAAARRRLDVAIAALPTEQRDAFLLQQEGGLGIDAIAEVTGSNRETVKSRLRYAGKKLRAALESPAIEAQRSA